MLLLGSQEGRSQWRWRDEGATIVMRAEAPTPAPRQFRRSRDFIVFGVFQSSDDRFGCQSMPDSVGSRSLFAIVGFRPGAPQRVASIGLELLK